MNSATEPKKSDLRFVSRIPRRLVAGCIRLYQATISPDHGLLIRWAFPHGYCRYHPTCSEYGRQAVLRRGVLRGLLRAMWRVLRCNPWSRGGVDEP
ncbi:membrane protein insertion efficiency factor YidD [Candidatus Uhrbacteria bacterium]|nr:membrane protein insertion efficiency factor YidD [Candidatus Uhrbacteria bacterium]